jgi:hypothetical protein
MKRYFLFVSILLNISCMSAFSNKWSLYLDLPGQKPMFVESFELNKIKDLSITKYMADCRIELNIKKNNGYWVYNVEVSALEHSKDCYLTFSRKYSASETPYCFNGEVKKSSIYRQSPHEPADHEMTGLLMQPVPMAGLYKKGSYEVAICNSPVYFDNYTTQTFDLKKKIISISSGDDGNLFNAKGELSFVDSLYRKGTKKYFIEPHFFRIDNKHVHKMTGIFMELPGKDMGDLREKVNEVISKHWSNGKITDLLGASVFSTSYMNLRINEISKSKYWVIPAIDYANKQYSRDAFWISMVLPDSFSMACYENEAANNTKFIGAERQLFTIVWAYRNFRNGMNVDTTSVRKLLTIVEKHAPNGYYSGFGPSRKPGCWQGWADDLAFDETDAITNNQGLYVVALKCAEKMGVKPNVSVQQALKNYQHMFNPKINGFAISHDKDSMLCVDALMGDLLAQLYLGERLISENQVLAHYETMKKYAKTKVGFKCFCAPDGSFLKSNQYNSTKYTAAVDSIENGTYQFGGSWYLYDMQMLMDAYLAGAKDAEDLMIWRTKLEFEKGNTTHEYINTSTRLPYKPNMGWNAGVYGIWAELIRQGKATTHFFDEINKLR